MEIIGDGDGGVVDELLGISVICAGIVTDPHLPQVTISSSTSAENENRDTCHVTEWANTCIQLEGVVVSCIQTSQSQSQESA